MSRIKRIADSMLYDQIIHEISESKEISLAEAKNVANAMSFKDYYTLVEAGSNIIPPSGITTGAQGNSSNVSNNTNNGQKVKPIWPGNGAPVEQGMTVGVSDANGNAIPGEVTQVDSSANGVKVKNTKTGEVQWMNIDSLDQVPVAEDDDADMMRLRELAGIGEDSSCGSTSAGGIAVSPSGMSGVLKRQNTDEARKKEYVPRSSAKTIIGDTKPNQASGELSATLAANGKKTATRANNGLRE